MIFILLLLIILTSCVCGTFVVNVTQTSYQAEENHNITLGWTFTTKADTSINSCFILCELFTDNKVSVLFHLHEGVEVPESQDQQFAGRVQWDEDVLREGRLTLHLCRLRTDDSGQYECEVNTNYGANYGRCRLSVTAARDWPEPERPNTASRGRIGLYCGLGLTAAAALLTVTVYLFTLCTGKKKKIYTPVFDLREVTAQRMDQRKQFDQQCKGEKTVSIQFHTFDTENTSFPLPGR